jgi:D-3-phosphoglycerate dehydrogenase
MLKHVFYVNYLPHADFTRILAERADITLTRLETDTPEAAAGPVLEAAHVYQISAAKTDLAPHFMADERLIRQAPNLILVSSSGAGYDPVDVDACTRAGILVVNQAGGNREAVAEHVIGLMIALSKRIIETDRIMRREGGIDRNHFLGRDIYGKTIGIVGLGHVGRRLAELCHGLFAMTVLAYDPYVEAAEMGAHHAAKVGLDALLRASDFVSVNCPLTAETRGMIGREAFAAMRPRAFFVTTARGGIHDEAALLAALVDKRIAGAGLDVWADEPPPPDHPLLALDTVIASPHTAGVTEDARANVARIAVGNLIAALDGRRPERIVNPQAWPHYRERFQAIFGSLPN